MKTMKHLFSGLLILWAGITQAQQRYELTVKEAVDLAYKNVIEIKNAQIDYKIQEAKNREVLGMAYPQVTGNVGANHYLKLPGILFPDATSTAVYSILKEEGVQGSSGPITNVPDPVQRQVSFQQPWNFAAGATLTQLLFQPDVFVGLQARETALNYSAAQIEQVKDRIKDSAYKRYYAILIAQKQLEFINQGIERLQKLYHDDSVLFVNGFAERLDLDKVQVQINNLTGTKNQVAAGIEVAQAGLKFALGISQKDIVVLKDDLTSANLKADLLVPDFKYEDRPEIRTLGYAKELQQLDIKRNRLGYIPTVAASANYSANAMSQKFFKDNIWINSAFIGLNINVPIFDGFQRKYKVQQSQLKLQQVENSINNVKQAIDLEQVATKEVLVAALKNLDIQESNMQLAEKVYNTTKIKFEQGVAATLNTGATTNFEVILAQSDLLNAQSNYFQALYSAIVAKISYQRSLGKLP
jgi:outer membrane protein TolC